MSFWCSDRRAAKLSESLVRRLSQPPPDAGEVSRGVLEGSDGRRLWRVAVWADGEALILFEGRLSPNIGPLGAVIAIAIGNPAGFLDSMLERGRPARTANTSTTKNHPLALRDPRKMMFACCFAERVQWEIGWRDRVGGRDARVPKTPPPLL
jgi:hypothetical protein